MSYPEPQYSVEWWKVYESSEDGTCFVSGAAFHVFVFVDFQRFWRCIDPFFFFNKQKCIWFYFSFLDLLDYDSCGASK